MLMGPREEEVKPGTQRGGVTKTPQLGWEGRVRARGMTFKMYGYC